MLAKSGCFYMIINQKTKNKNNKNKNKTNIQTKNKQTKTESVSIGPLKRLFFVALNQ